MDLNFLPKLPKANLDDRTYDDLIQECLLRIPRYCPEWTNFNPSDPGMTLVELFAWLTDQMLYRFNQVPRRNYITFLELLGVRLNPPKPAQVDVTMYLSASLPEPYTIAAGVEVATERTDEEEAVVFSTNRPLTIGIPSIRHFLSAQAIENRPRILRDRFSGTWSLRPDGEWEGLELSFFDERPQPGNCFYLVFDSDAPIAGNVIAITFKGEGATSTGIDPERPPRRWEAWNGKTWESVLQQESDDRTQGFSFSEMTRNGGNPLGGADVILHCPPRWIVETFSTYRGRWLRCVCAEFQDDRPDYLRSPRIVGLSVRSIGGTVDVTQSTRINNEILGESNGNPGQVFQLQSTPILPREDGEYLFVTPIDGVPQQWREVSDFSESIATDLHYTLDSLTGEIQFGPLIREPNQLRGRTKAVTESWRESRGRPQGEDGEDEGEEVKETQYGAIPPRGASIMMASYHTGGGLRGNVQTGTIRILKSAVPYIARVTNYEHALHGADAESLESAVMRVPKMLRTRDRAVTAEDFETLAIKAGRGSLARARCLPSTEKESAGTIELLLVPQIDPRTLDKAIERVQGISPVNLSVPEPLVRQVMDDLNERRLLGVEIQCREPQYVGVSVQTEIALEPEYGSSVAQQDILHKLQVALYRFLNPFIGGPDGKGWPFGRPVYSSDIVTLFQSIRGVRYLGTIQLFEFRYQDQSWQRNLSREPVISPGDFGLICSWNDPQLRSNHVINLMQ
ncbi:MAG: putative baseplate assembly protein [Cyanobacteria bacterium SBLK]|nr:putative baseplate assembly protein [Cyanobacteria bacterium SBLK]